MVLVISLSANAQSSCCSASSTEQFAQLALNGNFAAAHESPEPINYSPAKGKMITFPCKDGKDANAYFITPLKKSDNWIFIFHEWWGLNDYIKREADQFASDFPHANILAIDLYTGRIAESPAIAQQLMSSLTDERSRAIIQGALTFAGSKAKISTIGWCMGGGWSMQASIMAGKQAVACVIYYGMPEKDPVKLKSLQAEVLGIFAQKDNWINDETVKAFQNAMTVERKKLTVKWYDADHAFANPSNPRFNKIAMEDARKVTLQFLKSKVK